MNYKFGDILTYTSQQDETLKTPCVFIRYDHSAAVVCFPNAEWVARVNTYFLSKEDDT